MPAITLTVITITAVAKKSFAATVGMNVVRGASAGLAHGLVRITVERIRERRANVNRCRNNIFEVRARIERLINHRLSQAWAATAEGAVFRQQMDRTVRDLMLFIELLDRLLTVMQNSAADFEQAQRDNLGLANQLVSPLGNR